jgi:4-hydroxythreonine-4-phosphate dehydrogenase
MQMSDFGFPGHTEYLQDAFGNPDTLMFMINENMRIGVVTGHISLREVPDAVTADSLERKIRVMNHSLVMDFGIRKPRIAVLGLNPHSGDNGLMGNEEQEVLIPVIEKYRKQGLAVLGPYPSDGFFGSGAYRQFDGILAMYHDQALTPFKALSFDRGINYTAGLPVVRTSPAHGTAMEIAGKGEASEQSFRSALYTAVDIFRNRQIYDEINANPLKPQNVLDKNAKDETPDLSKDE